MKIIRPVTIDDTMFLNSTLWEHTTDYQEWNILTTYNAGDYVAVSGQENLFHASGELADATYWPATNGTTSANAQTSPSGATNAETFTENSGAGEHYISQSLGVTVSTSTDYTFSVYAKSSTRNVALTLDSTIFGASCYAYFTLTGDGTAVESNCTAKIYALDDDWYRISITAESQSSGTGTYKISLFSGSSSSYTGDGSSGAYLYGAQLEAYGFARTYVETYGGNAYDTGARSSAGLHRIYKALVTNGNNYPPISPSSWEEIGTTNRWKMFNPVVQDKTVSSGSFTVEFAYPGVINSIAFINMSATSVTIVVTDDVEGEVYNNTFSGVATAGIDDWYEYFFEPTSRDPDMAITGIPAYAGATIKVTFTDSTQASVGAIIVGQYAELGKSQHGAKLGIIDYSTKTTDAEGNVTITEGNYSNTIDVDIVLDTDKFPSVKKILTDNRTTPLVWIAQDNNKATVIYGYYREFDIVVANYTVSICELQIEGLS